MLFVPLILWMSHIIIAQFPIPGFFPKEAISVLEPYLRLQWTWAVPFSMVYGLYYFVLDPIAAMLYWPILALMTLSTGPILDQPWGYKVALSLFGLSWVAQFAGHGLAEKRAPALLDNLLGGLVLAPFFVHLEILFALGYRRQLHKEVTDGITAAIVEFRTERGSDQTPLLR